MEKEKSLYLINYIGQLLFLFRKPSKQLTNSMNYNINNFNFEILREINQNNILRNEFQNKTKTKNNEKIERYIKQIDFISTMKKDNLLHNICLNDKIIFVEGLKAWEKYGALNNNYSCVLFDEMAKISINKSFFSFQEKTNKILFNILKSKIKKINKDKSNIGSAVFCGLFFNKECDKMISISVGNILYSILRESSRQKNEIIYISSEQYHDINTPYQLSTLNNDYNYIQIKCHNINVNDIIIISNNKNSILSFIDEIDSKKDELNTKIEENRHNNNNYLAKYKVFNGEINSINSDNLSIYSTSGSL